MGVKFGVFGFEEYLEVKAILSAAWISGPPPRRRQPRAGRSGVGSPSGMR